MVRRPRVQTSVQFPGRGIRRTVFLTGEDGTMLRNVAWSCFLSVPTSPSGLVVTAARPVSCSLYTFSNSTSLWSPGVAPIVVSSHILRASPNFRHLLLFFPSSSFFFFLRRILQRLSRCRCCHARLDDSGMTDCSWSLRQQPGGAAGQ